jgi:hypothetical protein
VQKEQPLRVERLLSVLDFATLLLRRLLLRRLLLLGLLLFGVEVLAGELLLEAFNATKGVDKGLLTSEERV